MWRLWTKPIPRRQISRHGSAACLVSMSVRVQPLTETKHYGPLGPLSQVAVISTSPGRFFPQTTDSLVDDAN